MFSIGLFSNPVHAGTPTGGNTEKPGADGAVHLLVTRALRAPLEAVSGRLEAVAGRPVKISYNASENLKQEILKGRAFDVAIMVPSAARELFRAGKVLPGALEIARVPIGIGLRGEGVVDVSTPAALETALLNARSVKYGQAGAAATTVRAMFARLGVDGRLHDSSARTTEVPLAPGEYELNLYPLSEIIPNPKLRSLGPLPSEFQAPVIILAAVAKDSANPAAARALIAFLQGPAMDEALQANGLSKSTAPSRLDQMYDIKEWKGAAAKAPHETKTGGCHGRAARGALSCCNRAD